MRVQFLHGTRVVTKIKIKVTPGRICAAGALLVAISLTMCNPTSAAEETIPRVFPIVRIIEATAPMAAVTESVAIETCVVQTEIEGIPVITKTEMEKPESSSLLEQKISALPEEVRIELQEYGWTLKTVSKSELNNMGYGSILALTDYNTKTLYFRDQPYAIENSFYHELGHVMAANRRRCDLSIVFGQCYEMEKDSLIDVHEQGDRHCAINKEEFFATIVDDIFCSGDLYSESAPSGFAYVHENLGI